MRNPPKTVAKTSGTSTIAKTLERTGQLLSDQVRGRLAADAPAAGTSVDSGGAASTALAGRANMVTCSRPRDRPLR